MICLPVNNQGYKIKAEFDGDSLVKFELRDPQKIRYRQAVTIILNNESFDESNNAQIKLLQKIFLKPDKFACQIQKQKGKITVIFTHKSEIKRDYVRRGVGAVICGLVALVTAPLWVTTTSAAIVVGIASTVAIGAGCKVVAYAYNTRTKKFTDRKCVDEGIKGGVKGAVGGACAAGGVLLTPSLGFVAPIVVNIAGGGGGEMASQILDPKWNTTKILAESLGGFASAGTGSLARALMKKIPLDMIIDKVIAIAASSAAFKSGISDITIDKVKEIFIKAVSGAFAGSSSAAFRCATRNLLLGKELTKQLMANIIAGMNAGAVGDVLNCIPINKDSAAMALKTALVNGLTSAVRVVTKNRLTGEKLTHKLLSSIIVNMGGGAAKASVKLTMPDDKTDDTQTNEEMDGTKG